MFRGIEDGVYPGDPKYDQSPTLQLHGAKKLWIGNICFSDNHTDQIENFYPAQTTYEATDSSDGPIKDNIFAAEFGQNFNEGRTLSDSWMNISIYASSNGDWVLDRHDALIQ